MCFNRNSLARIDPAEALNGYLDSGHNSYFDLNKITKEVQTVLPLTFQRKKV